MVHDSVVFTAARRHYSGRAAVAVLRPPGARVRSAILHFAAGVVFLVGVVELLSDIVREHRPLEVGVGFGLSVALMLGLRAPTRRLETNEPAASGGDATLEEVVKQKMQHWAGRGVYLNLL